MFRNTLATAFTVIGLSMPAGAFDLTAMSDPERDAFRAEIRAYLLENPEVIIEAVELLEDRQKEDQIAEDQTLVQVNANEIYEDGYSWVGGNIEGDITLVEFLDYRCGYCRRAHPEVAELVQTDGNIRLIVKELPILGEQSLLTSQFAVAVKQVSGDEDYKTISDALMTVRGDISRETLGRLATDNGLDAETILARMSGPEVAQEIDATRQLAQRLQISGTPTFILEDDMIRGYVPLDSMEQMVSAARDG